jgi:O-antigen/teichoic acid export membrane protein
VALGKVAVGFWVVSRFGAEGAAVVGVAAEVLLAIIFFTWFARSHQLPFNWRLVWLVAWIGLVYAGVLLIAGLPTILKATLGILAVIAGGFWFGGLQLKDVRSRLAGFRLPPAIDSGERP